MLLKGLLAVSLLISPLSAFASHKAFYSPPGPGRYRGDTFSHLNPADLAAIRTEEAKKREERAHYTNIIRWLNIMVYNQPYKSLESLDLKIEDFATQDSAIEYFFDNSLIARMEHIEKQVPQSEFVEQKKLWESLNARDKMASERLSLSSQFHVSRIADTMLNLARIQLALTIISDELLQKEPNAHVALKSQLRRMADTVAKKMYEQIDNQLRALATTPHEKRAILNAVTNMSENFWLLHFKTLGATASEIASLDILADMNNNLFAQNDTGALDRAIETQRSVQRREIDMYRSSMSTRAYSIRGAVYSSLLFFTFVAVQNIPGLLFGSESNYQNFVESLQPFPEQLKLAAAQAGTTVDTFLKAHFTTLHSFFTSEGLHKLVSETLRSSAEALKIPGHENQLFWSTLLGMGAAGVEKIRSTPWMLFEKSELRQKERVLRALDKNRDTMIEDLKKLVASIQKTYLHIKAKHSRAGTQAECEDLLETETKVDEIKVRASE